MGLGVVELVPGVGGERFRLRILLVRRQLKVPSAGMRCRRAPVQLLFLVKLPQPATLYLEFRRRQKKRLVVRSGILGVDKSLPSNAARAAP